MSEEVKEETKTPAPVNVEMPPHSIEEALQHMCAWAIQHIFNTNKEAKAIFENEEYNEEKRLELLKGPYGTDYRLLNFILLLKPARKFAQEYFSEQHNFFEWFDERCQFVKENKLVDGECGCLGCKKYNQESKPAVEPKKDKEEESLDSESAPS